MKAYRWNGPGTGLQLQNVSKPQPRAGQVLIEVEACGLCHSDCHILNGSQAAAIKQYPITLGHEIAGTVVEVGQGVDDSWIGDRVCVALGGHPIRTPDTVGLQVDGGYARYVAARQDFLVRIPATVGFEAAAVATDSLTTSYHAVRSAGQVTAGLNVAIIGLGGLGTPGVRFAALQGANVYGFDIDTQKFDKALQNGATACFTHLDQVDNVEFDVIVDFVGISATITAALKAIKFRGRIVLVGLGAPTLTVPTFGIVWNKVEIVGCLGGSKQDLADVMELVASGKLKLDLEEVPFETVEAGLDRLESGKVVGRMFTRPSKSSI